MKNHLAGTIVSAVILGGALGPADAQVLQDIDVDFIGPIVYQVTSDSPFAPLTLDYFHLETLEDGGLNTPGVSASAFLVQPPGSITDSVDGDDGAIDGSGTGGHSMFHSSGPEGLTFTFDVGILGNLPTHVGIVWTDGEGTTGFEVFGPGGLLGTIGPVSTADAVHTGTTGEDRFFGAINPGGISSIRLFNSAGGIEADHLQYGYAESVPEPSTILLLGTGLAALAGMRRARKGVRLEWH